MKILLPPLPTGYSCLLMFHRCEFAATPQNHPNRLVLVVEAAPQFIEDLTEQLTSLGYLVVIACSGTEALERSGDCSPEPSS